MLHNKFTNLFALLKFLAIISKIIYANAILINLLHFKDLFAIA